MLCCANKPCFCNADKVSKKNNSMNLCNKFLFAVDLKKTLLNRELRDLLNDVSQVLTLHLKIYMCNQSIMGVTPIIKYLESEKLFC